LQPCLCQQR